MERGHGWNGTPLTRSSNSLSLEKSLREKSSLIKSHRVTGMWTKRARYKYSGNKTNNSKVIASADASFVGDRSKQLFSLVSF